MHVLADLQIHSRFSRAVSKTMTLPVIAEWARKKGIGIVATGDWTHPVWFREIERDLEEIGNGLLRLTDDQADAHTPFFLLATEVSCIYSQNGRVRRVHTLLWVPSLASARAISQEMTKRGCNLLSDGRPIVGLTSMQLAELVFSIEPLALIIPAHAWTPWFSVYGSLGGFDSLTEAFGPYAEKIYAIETGLSSNPAMNWRIPELDARSIVSFSDAHSAPKLGREATVFDIPDGNVCYSAISEALKNVEGDTRRSRIAYTIEFYPEEGKYHLTGHRSCSVCQTPKETREKGTRCPVCGGPLTVGVMHRVDDLAKRSDSEIGLRQVPPPDPAIRALTFGSRMFPNRPPFIMTVPLLEILAETLGVSVASAKVQSLYIDLIERVGSEFSILLTKQYEEIAVVGGERVARAIEQVRTGKLTINPGYDGVYGVVKIWEKDAQGIIDPTKEQLSFELP